MPIYLQDILLRFFISIVKFNYFDFINLGLNLELVAQKVCAYCKSLFFLNILFVNMLEAHLSEYS
jgi:hypothetical protein